ncbi:MAG: right-handed parallel beta-helix repeat-containing protein [Isosphaeraceae bacterium]|nr:right-handed parallel beta-helix repeat-containing protein [Isosphaeraceae bacterium]
MRQDLTESSRPGRRRHRERRGIVVEALEGRVLLATFAVTNTNDSGSGSLREAMTLANSTAGLDTIAFAIPGTGPFTISPLSPLPPITDPVILDGYTQPGAQPNTLAVGDNAILMIELNGAQAGTGTDGLTITQGGGGSTIQGLAINRFDGAGISLTGTSGNTIAGNFLGTNISGTARLANLDGVMLNGSSNNTIGGTTPGARNISSGNTRHGVSFFNSSFFNSVQNNYLGTNAAGDAPLGNDSDGVFNALGCNFNTIGGATTTARNVISDNGLAGVAIFGPSFGNTVQNNFVGTDATGTRIVDALGNRLGNRTYGVAVSASVEITDNVIAGNLQDGLTLGPPASGVLVQDNFIGTDLSGTLPLGNAGRGIFIDGANGNLIGGVGGGSVPASLGNTIAFNGAAGVFVNSGTGNAILSNSIFSNGGLGIDLAPAGVTPNDPGDGDSGPNDLQNFPILTSVTSSGGTTTIQGMLNSTPSTTFRIEFFNDDGDPSGFGQGRTFLGAIMVTTDGAGNANFSATLSTPGTLRRSFTATATSTTTDPEIGTVFVNTSEFSNAITLPADLAVTKVDSPDPAAVGQDLVYTVTVTNRGPYDALGVLLTDTLPAGVTFVSATGGATPVEGVLTFNLGTMAPGASATISILVRPNATGVIANSARVTSRSTDPDPSNNTATQETTVEEPGTFTFSAPTYTVSESGPVATITVTRTGGRGGTVSVHVATSDGTATAGMDYIPAALTLTFAPGQTSQTFNIGIIDDNIYEGNETVNLALSSPTGGARLGTPSSAVLTIIDNEPPPALSISDASVIEGDSGTVNALFTVSLSVPSALPISVNYTTADGTATAGVDHIATRGTLTFALGQTSQTLAVPVLGDLLVEGDETASLILSDPTNGAVLGAHHIGTLTIIDDDSFVVTNTNDSGQGSLRKAILVANANPGQNRITFDIPGMEVHTIRLASPLPSIDDPVILDGYSQPGSRPNTATLGDDAALRIVLDGSRIQTNPRDPRVGYGLVVNAGNSVIQGLVIQRFPIAGIALVVQGGNVIRGNFIGTDASGTRDLGNGLDGIYVVDSSDNTIGGTTPADRNLIAGNGSNGIQIFGQAPVTVGAGPDEQFGTADDVTIVQEAARNRVQGNWIGTDISGTARLGNARDGIFLNQAANNLIGGPTAPAGNVISGNGSVGVLISGAAASGNVIQGNRIGTDAAGSAPLGNDQDGVFINRAPSNLIGGTEAGASNLIAANGFSGVDIADAGATGNAVLGNLIGVGLNGEPLGNRGYGVIIENTTGNTIGGAAPNTIANNRFGGVIVIINGNPVFDPNATGNGVGANRIANNDLILLQPAASPPPPHTPHGRSGHPGRSRRFSASRRSAPIPTSPPHRRHPVKATTLPASKGSRAPSLPSQRLRIGPTAKVPTGPIGQFFRTHRKL